MRQGYGPGHNEEFRGTVVKDNIKDNQWMKEAPIWDTDSVLRFGLRWIKRPEV